MTPVISFSLYPVRVYPNEPDKELTTCESKPDTAQHTLQISKCGLLQIETKDEVGADDVSPKSRPTNLK